MIIGNVNELGTVILGNDKLSPIELVVFHTLVRSGKTYSVTLADRANVEESQRLFALEELQRRDLSYTGCGQLGK